MGQPLSTLGDPARYRWFALGFPNPSKKWSPIFKNNPVRDLTCPKRINLLTFGFPQGKVPRSCRFQLWARFHMFPNEKLRPLFADATKKPPPRGAAERETERNTRMGRGGAWVELFCGLKGTRFSCHRRKFVVWPNGECLFCLRYVFNCFVATHGTPRVFGA